MAYKPRIPVDPEYVQAVGQAHYNFVYMEWGIVWTIVKLSEDGFESVPRGRPAGQIATAFIRAIHATQPPLDNKLRNRLVKLHERFLEAIRTRNQLLHAHPFTAEDGTQQLGGSGWKWEHKEIEKAALLFENLAIDVNDLFHGQLKEVRP